MPNLADSHIYGGLTLLAIGAGLVHIGLGLAVFGAGLIVLGALYALREAESLPTEES